MENQVLPQWLSFTLGFLSVGPLMLLFSVKSIKEYGGPLGGLWHRFVEPRLDQVSRRYVSFGVLAGMFGGALSIPFVELFNVLLFPEVDLAVRPREPMALLTQIAFIQAGLIEEVAKNALGLVFAFLVCRAPRTAAADSQHGSAPPLFLKSVPFLFAGVGLGFALLENSQYIRYYSAMGPGGVFIGRSLMATSTHALLNLYFGLCLLTATRETLAKTSVRALAVVIVWHGVYDFFAIPPVALSGWLTLVFLCFILYMTLSKMYYVLPELRYRPLRPAAEVAAEQEALSGLGAPASPPWPAPESAGARDEPPGETDLIASATDDWHRRLAVLAPVPPRYRELFCTDAWRYRFPPGGADMPYELSEFEPFSPKLLVSLARSDLRGPGASVPSNLAATWSQGSTDWCRVFEVAQPNACWNISVFAHEAEAQGAELARLGVDLTQTVPFQVLEFRVKNPEPPASVARAAASIAPQRVNETAETTGADAGERYIYITQGLKVLYERELFVSFSNPHPMIRWFFLNLASVAADQAPWLREFHAFYSDTPARLGDPRGWLRFYITVPLFDPILSRFVVDEQAGGLLSLTDVTRENEATAGARLYRSSEELPLQVLLCAYPDGAYIARRGVPSYLQMLRHLNLPWHNDFRRPPVVM